MGSDLNQLAEDLDRVGLSVVARFSTHPHWDHRRSEMLGEELLAEATCCWSGASGWRTELGNGDSPLLPPRPGGLRCSGRSEPFRQGVRR
jgi:hypothetical protein